MVDLPAGARPHTELTPTKDAVDAVATSALTHVWGPDGEDRLRRLLSDEFDRQFERLSSTFERRQIWQDVLDANATSDVAPSGGEDVPSLPTNGVHVDIDPAKTSEEIRGGFEASLQLPSRLYNGFATDGRGQPEESSESIDPVKIIARQTRRTATGKQFFNQKEKKANVHWNILLEDRKISNGKKSGWHDRAWELVEWWMSLEEPKRSGRLAKFVTSTHFDSIAAFVIMTNAVFTWVSTDYELRSLSLGNEKGAMEQPFILGLELFYLGFYTLELGLKLAVHKFAFFYNMDMRWNIFDFALVAFSTYDMATTTFETANDDGGDAGPNLTFMRTLRIFKMAKILRVVRVMRFFTELRLMLNSLVGSMLSLFWSFVMIGFIFYIFGLIFVQGVTSAILLLRTSDDGINGDAVAPMLKYFGSVSTCMLTLFKATTGGDDWSMYLTILDDAGMFYIGLFLFFEFFIQVALLNILTGMFVENAMKLAQPDRETLALEQRKKEIAEMNELHAIVSEIDKDRSGKISAEEFYRTTHSPKMKAYLTLLGLDVKDAEMFFNMLVNVSDKQEVDIESFVNGCMRLRGPASSVDLQGLAVQARNIQESQRHFVDQLVYRMDRIDALVAALAEGAFAAASSTPSAKCLAALGAAALNARQPLYAPTSERSDGSARGAGSRRPSTASVSRLPPVTMAAALAQAPEMQVRSTARGEQVEAGAPAAPSPAPSPAASPSKHPRQHL
eukprot:TRINITY_DN26819_c0_g1_i1.p1 TRINITY_DN26819_c0_g1~~TRINITY_DN26819_c0_g1_i1.p1  ORF type:complete len:731 (-),score=167.86 TRINITY_DN26819_c0_g1_i1:97-2289(-)